MEIVMRDKRIQQLQQSCNEMSTELNQYKIDLAAFEKQTNNLTRSLATSERTVKHLDMDKARLLREIQAARDLASSFERNKDDLSKNVTITVLENEKLEHSMRQLEGERESLLNQLKAEVWSRFMK
jgi:chromosome segregation ATPase